MSISKKEWNRIAHLTRVLTGMGFAPSEVEPLRRISTGLRRWFERECNGEIERDEATNAVYHVTNVDGPGPVRRFPARDLEAGHMRRLKAIMAGKPGLSYYVQSDPRGASLYILRPGDVPEGESVGAYYTRGICVY